MPPLPVPAPVRRAPLRDRRSQPARRIDHCRPDATSAIGRKVVSARMPHDAPESLAGVRRPARPSQDAGGAAAAVALRTTIRSALRACTSTRSGVLFDYSKQRATDETLDTAARSRPRGGPGATPHRAFRRRADQRDRAPPGLAHGAAQPLADGRSSPKGKDVMPDVRDVREKMLAFADAIRERHDHRGRQALHRCRQHRHRRLGSRAGDGGARARDLRARRA